MATIEYFYSAHSAFAYLGSARFTEIAEAAGARVVHKPVELNRVLAGAHIAGFKERTPQHRAYYFGRELIRWSEYRNAPVLGRRPTHHDADNSLCNGMLIAGIQQGLEIGPLAHAMLQGHWRDDADLSDADTLIGLAGEVAIDPAPLIAAALTDGVQAEYNANTEEAIARSVFGSPTYFVDGDMFYGQDHLELVERALKQPFAGDWPPK